MNYAWDMKDRADKMYLAVVKYDRCTNKYIRVSNEREAIIDAAFDMKGISLLLPDGSIATTSIVVGFDGLNIKTSSRWYINVIEQMLG